MNQELSNQINPEEAKISRAEVGESVKKFTLEEQTYLVYQDNLEIYNKILEEILASFEKYKKRHDDGEVLKEDAAAFAKNLVSHYKQKNAEKEDLEKAIGELNLTEEQKKKLRLLSGEDVKFAISILPESETMPEDVVVLRENIRVYSKLIREALKKYDDNLTKGSSSQNELRRLLNEVNGHIDEISALRRRLNELKDEKTSGDLYQSRKAA